MYIRFPIRSTIFLMMFVASWFGLTQLISHWVQSSTYSLILAFAMTLNISLILLLMKIWVFGGANVANDTLAVDTPINSEVSIKQGSNNSVSGFETIIDDASFTLGVDDFESPQKVWASEEVVSQNVDIHEHGDEGSFISSNSTQSNNESNSSPASLASENHNPKKRDSEHKSPINNSNIPLSQESFFTDIREKIVETSTGNSQTSVESAYVRAYQLNARSHRSSNQLERFRQVCLVLKQANLEVAVWTDQELKALQQSQLTSSSTEADMVAVLLPKNVAYLTSAGTQPHAQIFKGLLLVVNKQLNVKFVTSVKSADGKCKISFEYQGRLVSWRFSENSDSISSKFLDTAMHWVGKKAGGEFLPISQSKYVFIQEHVIRQLEINATASA